MYLQRNRILSIGEYINSPTPRGYAGFYNGFLIKHVVQSVDTGYVITAYLIQYGEDNSFIDFTVGADAHIELRKV